MPEKKYSISEMADLLGVTTHMLRHYEKLGIIQPEVNPENGYRFYSVLDTRRLNLSREFLACGIPLEQCAQIMGDMDGKKAGELFAAGIQKQRRQLELSRIAIRFLERMRDIYVHVPERVNRVWAENLRPMWRLNVSRNEKTILTDRQREQREEWLNCLPAVYWTSRIRRVTLRQFGSGPIDYEYGLMCYEEDAQALGLEKTEDVEAIPGGDDLVTVHDKRDRGPFTWENLGALTAYIRSEGVSLYGDAFSHILCSRTEAGEIVNYHRVFMKIFS